MRHIVVLAAALSAAGCHGRSDPPDRLIKAGFRSHRAPPRLSSSEVDGTFAFSGGAYGYTLVKPRSAPAKAPLVIALHGEGSAGWRAIERFDMVAFAERHRCVVIAPNAHSSEWHDLTKDPGQAIDLKFFSNLLDAVPTLGGDPRRVYVMGFSNGGSMAYLLGAMFPERIAAIAAGGATIGALDLRLGYHAIPRPKGPVSVFIFHGMKDEMVGYDMHTFTVAAPDAARWWARNNGIDVGPVRWVKGHGKVLIDRYVGQKGVEVVQMSYTDIGHDWPSSEDKKTGVVFNDALWDFFSRHKL